MMHIVEMENALIKIWKYLSSGTLFMNDMLRIILKKLK
jgi:hypothetical protein